MDDPKMQRRVIVVVALVAFVACVALILFTRGEPDHDVVPLENWKDCSTKSVKIKSVELTQCNKTLMTERCALKEDDNFNIKVHFVQGDFEIKVPNFNIEFAPGWSQGGGGRCAYGLECPGELGTEQYLDCFGAMSASPGRETNITMKFTVQFNYDGQKRHPVKRNDLLCLEIPTFIVYSEKPKRSVK